MNGRYLLDTNIVIALFADETDVKRKLVEAPRVFVNSVVLGELFFGARKSARPDSNLARLEEFAAEVSILPCNIDTSRRYGQVKNLLRVKGRPLPENDIWVAASAIQHGLTLVTRDRHFTHVDDLDIESW